MNTKLSLLFCLAILSSLTVSAAIFTVTIPGGNNKWAGPYTAGSYQKALQDSKVAGTDTIIFDYAALGNSPTITYGQQVFDQSIGSDIVINGLIGLPAGSEYVKLVGTGVWGGSGTVKVAGSNAILKGLIVPNSASFGAYVTGSNNTIDSCYFYNNTADGIHITGTGNTVSNCNIGFTFTKAESGNKHNGVFALRANSTTVTSSTIMYNGKTSAGNDKISGVRIEGSTGAIITNNFIGTDASKTLGGNGFDGITIYEGSNNSLITGNTICNNGFDFSSHGEGIAVRNSTTCTIQSNFIGNHQDGTSAGNRGKGISLEGAKTCLIGGATVILGNTITSSPSSAVGSGYGILLQDRALSSGGASVACTGNEIYNNLIGDVQNNNPALGNNNAGISIKGNSDNNIVGSLGAGNSFGGNNTGISVEGAAADKNTLRYNSFTCNTLKGIALVSSGNDEYGIPAGVKTVTVNTSESRPTYVSGFAPSGAEVDIYVADNNCAVACDNDAYQGATYVATVTATGTNWEYDFSGTAVNQSNVVVMATEQGVAGQTNSSEFSVCRISCEPPTNVTINGSNFCKGLSTTLTANSNTINSTGTYQYYWYKTSVVVGNEIVPRTAINDSDIVVNSAGTYFVVVSETKDSAACSMRSPAFTLNEISNPVVTVNSESICPNAPAVTFTATSDKPAASFLWSDNGSGSIVTTKGTTPGNYTVEVTDNDGCVGSGTGTLTTKTAPVVSMATNNPLGSAFCFGGSVQLNAFANTGTIIWTPAQAAGTTQITVSTVGKYYISVTDPGTNCISEDSIEIIENALPIVDITAGGKFCQGKSVTLDAGLVGMDYSWTPNNETTQTISVTKQDSYTVVVTDPTTGCHEQSTGYVSENPYPDPKFNLGKDDSICYYKGESLELKANLVAGSGGTIEWSNGTIGDSTTTYSDTVTVWVKYTDTYNCTGADTLKIHNYCEPPVVDVPNIFIPGGCPTCNPTFTPIGNITPEDVLHGRMEVYDRWGLKMFETTDLVPKWDGTYNGRVVSTGVYFWIWIYEDVTLTEHKLNGFVEVLKKN